MQKKSTKKYLMRRFIEYKNRCVHEIVILTLFYFMKYESIIRARKIDIRLLHKTLHENSSSNISPHSFVLNLHTAEYNSTYVYVYQHKWHRFN